MRRLGQIGLPVVLACSVFGAGCGGRDAGPATSPKDEAAIAACKQRIEKSALPAALKDGLRASCAQQPSGDGMASPDQKTRRKACRKIVLQRTPPGAARERGLAACALNTRNP